MRLAVAGVAMWILAYPLTFTTYGYHIRGRPTRVHLAAAVGSSLTVAAVATASVQAASSTSGRRRRLVGLAAWMAFMTGYGLVLQRDYVLAWTLQKQFWSRLLPLVQDAGEGTVILVDPAGLEDVYQIAANTWNLPRVLDQLLVLPAAWEDPPRVFRLTPDWADFILDEDGNFALDASTTVAPPSLYGTAPAANVILIETRGGDLRRHVGSITLGSREVNLRRAAGSGIATAPRALLGKLLFGEEEPRPDASAAPGPRATPVARVNRGRSARKEVLEWGG
jgi:hypothetical protein